jgi:2-phospho-L-lactate transferase/gluconeogenesis factor (CofD/UPF0052 family)
VKTTDFSANGIRQVLLARQKQDPEPIILIMPLSGKAVPEDKQSKYKNMVDILDEMNITNQKKYALVNIPTKDVELLKKLNLI